MGQNLDAASRCSHRWILGCHKRRTRPSHRARAGPSLGGQSRWACRRQRRHGGQQRGNTGIDLLALDPDKTLHQVLEQGGPVGQMGTSNIERFLGENAPTVREILDQLRGRGTRGFRLVGDPVQVADGIERLAAETDLDGFLLEPVFEPADLEDFGRLVMPILRERGRLRAGVPGNTLRSRVTERPGHDRLGDAHPVLAD